MKYIYLLLFMAMSSSTIWAQNVVFSHEPVDKSEETFGPNRFKFAHSTFSFGGFMPGAESDRVTIAPEYNWGKSYYVQFGARYKTKLAKALAICFDWGYTFNRVYFDDYEGAISPEDLNYNFNSRAENTRILMHELYAEFNIRVVANNRGNVIGNYLDVGAYGAWQFANSSRSEYEGLDVKEFTPDFDNRLYYGFQARLGWNHIAIPVRYRAMNIIYDDLGWSIPPYSIGIEFSFY